MFFDKDDVILTILDVLKIEQSSTTLFNSGRNFNGLSYRISSDTQIITDYEEYHLQDNSVCFVPAQVDYMRRSNKDELIVVHFNIMNYSFKNVEAFYTKNPKKMLELFQELLECWNKRDIGYKYKCDALFKRILEDCYIENYLPKNDKTPILASIEYMKNNFNDENITVGEIAEKSFISEVYFRKLFKSIYGISPVKYLIMLRIENAVALMSTGYYTLKEVAKLSGYGDYSYFSAEFKRIKGVSPSKYHYSF